MRTLTKHSGQGFKAIGDAGTFEGYGSMFGNLDLGGDIVVKGAYAKTLAQRGPKGIKMLWAHDSAQPIGIWEDLYEDDSGLFCRGRLLLELPKGAEVYTLMRNGVVDGLSIGYQVVNSARDAANGARLLQEVDLREISVVTFPMNETSLISSVKGELPTEREFERFLTQDAGFTRSQARTIIGSGFKALRDAKPGAGDEGAAEDFDWDAVRSGLEGLISDIRS
jgi:HK97 family phage prohead protease